MTNALAPMTKEIRNPNFEQAALDIQPLALFRDSGFVISHSRQIRVHQRNLRPKMFLLCDPVPL